MTNPLGELVLRLAPPCLLFSEWVKKVQQCFEIFFQIFFQICFENQQYTCNSALREMIPLWNHVVVSDQDYWLSARNMTSFFLLYYHKPATIPWLWQFEAYPLIEIKVSNCSISFRCSGVTLGKKEKRLNVNVFKEPRQGPSELKSCSSIFHLKSKMAQYLATVTIAWSSRGQVLLYCITLVDFTMVIGQYVTTKQYTTLANKWKFGIKQVVKDQIDNIYRLLHVKSLIS